MATKTAVVKVESTSPMLMHSKQFLVDPLSEQSRALKAVSSKRKKTDDDQLKMAEIEWKASIYADANGDVILPGFLVRRALKSAGTMRKNGKTVERGVLAVEVEDFEYGGPKSAMKLWAVPEFRSRLPVSSGGRPKTPTVMRTRPQFLKWTATMNVVFDADIIDPDILRGTFVDLGTYEGLNDGRNIGYGRFKVAEFTIA